MCTWLCLRRLHVVQWRLLFRLGIVSSVVFSIWGVALVVGCQPFRPQVRPLDQGLPSQFSLYSGDADSGWRWWESFQDPELNRLVEDALAGNFDIQQAWARLQQARTLAVQAGADRFPDLTGSADYLKGRQRSAGGVENGYENAGVGLVSRYEIDLWGRVQARQRSARLRAEGSRQDLNAAAVTIAAEVARLWVGILTQRMQHALLQEQLRTNRILLELVELRFRNALASALDVYQQKQLVDNVLAEIPLVEQEEQLLLHQMAVLAGKPPSAELRITGNRLPELAPLPPTGLPADLLAARPDVMAAGLRLQAADWQIAEARANRLPALSLTGRTRYGEGELEALLDNWLLSLAANLILPLIDGGQRRAEVDRTRAAAEEQLAAYRGAVYTAVKEVEDALVQETKQREHIVRLGQVADTARKALEEAGVRYRKGLNDYLPVLTQLLSVQNLERDLIRRQANLLATRVGLFRALGGNWPNALPLPEPDTKANNRAGSMVND
jgi:outer membrane protein, multidrug efflux system